MTETAIHICFVSPNIYPLFNTMVRAPYSETEIQLFELARFFGQNDSLLVSVVTNDFGQDDVEFYSGVLVYRLRDAFYIPFLRRFRSDKTPLKTLLKKINADVYVVAGAWDGIKDVAEFCQKNSRAFVFRVSHQRDCDGSITKSLTREGENYAWALSHATSILCQTEEQRMLLRRTENLSGIVIPNAVHFPTLPSSYPRQDVVWIGEIVEWKQPEYFLRLALTIPQQSFTLFAYPRDMNYYERLVEKTRDIPNLGFQNNVPYHEIPFFLEKAKLLVNTSRFEGHPYFFSLANALGVPIASLNVDPDGVIEKSEIGIYAHGSEVRMAEEVLSLVLYENQLKRFRDNALLFARSNNDIQRIGNKVLKILVQQGLPHRL